MSVIIYLHSQDNTKDFKEQILISYRSDSRLNTQKAKENFFKQILKQSNIDFKDGNYIFIPQYDLVFKKLSSVEKEEIRKHSELENNAINSTIQDSIIFAKIDKYIKNKYLTYLDTKRLFLTGMYIYKDSALYGRIRENPYTHELFFYHTDVKNETNWVAQFASIIIEQQPTLLFTIRSPNSPLFLLFQNYIKVLEFNSIKKQTLLIDIEEYLQNKDFVFDASFISDKRNVPIVSN